MDGGDKGDLGGDKGIRGIRGGGIISRGKTGIILYEIMGDNY